jgi:small subunit ribosomal protein S16
LSLIVFEIISGTRNEFPKHQNFCLVANLNFTNIENNITMVVIRLSRGGAKKRPFYHIVVTDSRNRRDGRYIERLGFFNPIATGKEEPLRLNLTRAQYWLGIGAQPSERVAKLIKQYKKNPPIGTTVTETTPTVGENVSTEEQSAPISADQISTEPQSTPTPAENSSTDEQSTPAAAEKSSTDEQSTPTSAEKNSTDEQSTPTAASAESTSTEPPPTTSPASTEAPVSDATATKPSGTAS